MNTMQLPDRGNDNVLESDVLNPAKKLTTSELDKKIKDTTSLITALSRSKSGNEAMRQKHIGDLQIELATLLEENQKLISKEIDADEKFLIKESPRTNLDRLITEAIKDPVGSILYYTKIIETLEALVLRTDQKGLSTKEQQSNEVALRDARKIRDYLNEQLKKW